MNNSAAGNFNSATIFASDGGHKLVTSNNGFHAVFTHRIRDLKEYKLYYVTSNVSGGNWSSLQELDNININSPLGAYTLSDPSLFYYNNDIYICYYKSGIDETATGGQNNIRKLRLIKLPNGRADQMISTNIVEAEFGHSFFITDIYVDSTSVYVAVTDRDTKLFTSVRVYKLDYSLNKQEEYHFGYPALGEYPTINAGAPIFSAGNTSTDFFLTYAKYDFGISEVNKDNPTGNMVVLRHTASGWSNVTLNIVDGYIAYRPSVLVSGNQLLVSYSKKAVQNGAYSLGYRVYHDNTFASTAFTEITTNVSAPEILTTRLGLTTANIPVIQYVFHDGQNYKIGQIHLKSPTEWSTPTKSITTAGGEGAGSASVYAHMLPGIIDDQPYMLWYDYQNKKVWFNHAPDKISPWKPLTPNITWITSNVNTTGNQIVTLSLTAAPARSTHMFYEVFRVPSSGVMSSIASGNWLANADALTVTLNDVVSAGQRAALSADDQYLVLRARARDEHDNESTWSGYTALIHIPDRTPPRITTLNTGEDADSIFITLNAVDKHNVTSLNVSYKGSTLNFVLGSSPPLATVQPSVNVTLNFAVSRNLFGVSGQDTIGVQVFDAQGNYAASVMGADISPPSGLVIINNGAHYTNTLNVRLKIYAEDELGGSGIDKMYVSNTHINDPSGITSWENYAPTDNYHGGWRLAAPPNEGAVKRVYVYYRDGAGNIIETTAEITYTQRMHFHFIEPDGIDDVASDNFTLSWEAEYAGDNDAEVRFYYVGVTSDGVHTGEVSGDVRDIITGGLAQGILLRDPVRGVIWDTRDLDSGYYYVYAVVSGNSGVFEEKAPHPIYVKHEKGVIPSDPDDPDPPSVPTGDGQTVTSNPPSILIIEPWTNYNAPPITKLPIWWHEAHQPGDGAVVSLYYSSSPTLSGIIGVISENIPASTTATSDRRQLDGDWTVPDLPNGTYYIIGVIRTADFTNWDASTGRLISNKDDVTSGNGGTGEGIWSYPNPFAPQTRDEVAIIAYRVAKDQWTRVYIYNIRGERIWHIDNYAYAGQDNTVRWDGRLPRGNYAGNGIYVLFLTDEKRKVLERGRLTLLD
ncbi:MAG: hypothetical protein LBK68_07260 [Candidatus Margulisbacteria bacterium]|nr:hypothetical protein [Candidatus Margulisiibacteriota bacterium]